MRSGRNNQERGGFHGRGSGGGGSGGGRRYHNSQSNRGSGRRDAQLHGSPHQPPPLQAWGRGPPHGRAGGEWRVRMPPAPTTPPAQPGDHHLTQVCGACCNRRTMRAFCFPLPFPFGWRPRLFISCGYSLGD